MYKMRLPLVALALVVLLPAAPASAQQPPGSGFTYQGLLKKDGVPYTGTCDIVARLFDDPIAGTEKGVSPKTTTVSAGLFTVELDFGSDAYNGEARWLSLAFRCPADQPTGYTDLLPRQKVTAAPFAVGLRDLRTSNNPTSPNVIGGHKTNVVTAGVFGATLVGGGTTGNANRVTDDYGAVVGGEFNRAGDSVGTTTDRTHAFVGGGRSNAAGGQFSAIAGGDDNGAAGMASAVGGGSGNDANGAYSAIPGGYGNATSVSGLYAFAAGRQAHADHEGTFVWADSLGTNFTSTGIRQFLVRASNGMGVGTASPQTQLHVAKSINADSALTSHVVVVENTSTGANADVLLLKIGQGGNAIESNNFITFFDGNNTSLGAIQGNSAGSVVLAGAGNDYAEWLPKEDPSEEIRPGDIVGVFAGRVTKKTAGATHVMAASAGPIVAGNDPGEKRRAGHVAVAFIGQVPVRVRGSVRAGDFIVASGENDGIGLAVSPESITPEMLTRNVGRAWQEAGGAGAVHTVRIVVGLTQSDPTVARLVELAQSQARSLATLEARLAALEGSRERGGVLTAALP